MTQHEENIIKLADWIAKTESTGNYLTNEISLARLNGMVEAHAMVTGTKPLYYTQETPESAKDYAD
jgi:hypothetical protein